MKAIKASELDLFVGQKVRVVYPVDRGLQGTTIIVDDLITDEVLLKKYDPKTQEITFERAGGVLQTMRPKQVFPAL